MFRPTANSQQPTANSQQPTANSQQPTANSQQPTALIMNFLSHYYFDRHSMDPNRILGTVLPDLVKNANRRWSLHPHKFELLMQGDPSSLSILGGWMRHLEVDRYFHSSEFFLTHTERLRALIKPALTNTPVRPSFLAHVALELMLDSLLITESKIDTHRFYERLSASDRNSATHFLRCSGLTHTTEFFVFLDKFISSGYLHSYRETPNMMYALNRICMKLWNDPLDECQNQVLTGLLLSYREDLAKEFTDIFAEIEQKLA